jgi:cell division protein FtsB
MLSRTLYLHQTCRNLHHNLNFFDKTLIQQIEEVDRHLALTSVASAVVFLIVYVSEHGGLILDVDAQSVNVSRPFLGD